MSCRPALRPHPAQVLLLGLVALCAALPPSAAAPPPTTGVAAEEPLLEAPAWTAGPFLRAKGHGEGWPPSPERPVVLAGEPPAPVGRLFSAGWPLPEPEELAKRLEAKVLVAGDPHLLEVVLRNPEDRPMTVMPRLRTSHAEWSPAASAADEEARARPVDGRRFNAPPPSTAPPDVKARLLDDAPLRMHPGVAYKLLLAVEVPAEAEAGWRLVFHVEGTSPDAPGRSLLLGSAVILTAPPVVPEVRGATALPPSILEILTATFATGSAFTAAWIATATRREDLHALLLAPIVGLFTRLARQDVLTQQTREHLHALVKAQPGITYATLKDHTGLAPGVLMHHLRILERHRVLVSRKEDRRRVYYVTGTPLPPPGVPAPRGMQARVLAIAREGPLTQSAIAARLGITQQAVSYHMRELDRKGLLGTGAPPA